MSIFKSTINDEIAAQLKARQHVISSSNRSDDFLRYTSGKNGWVRMTSFVNYNDPKGKYSGDQLSKKYVLEGGTLRQTSSKEFSLRSGVGKYDGVYAGDIDKISSNPTDNKVDRMYGLRPMPGITNVNVMNKGAYGSLREATIQFYAWDKHQLEELELLFMRTGYTVFLEWGWSQYITHDKNGSKGINSLPDNIKIKNFDDVTFNPFQSNKISEDAVYKKIDDTVSNARGNYDAMLGFVKNFSWQLMPNGGFQCSTTLISRGEAIETIKASANPYTILGSISSNTSLNEIQPVYSVFEKIFLNIIGHLNESEFAESVSTDSKVRGGQLSFPGIDVPTKDALRDQANATYDEIQKRLANGKYKQIDRDLNITLTSRDLNTSTVIKPSTGQLEGTAIEYISIRSFLAILNEFFIFKDKNSQNFQPAVTILLPNGTECLASEDSVSIDPTTCLIQNSAAKFITQTNTGFVPNMFWGMQSPSAFSSDDGTSSSKVSLTEFLLPNTTNRGDISSIFIGINHIIQRYRQLSGGPNGVDIITLLQTILDDISFALGGINNFKLYNNRNVLQIIDANYLGTAKKEDKFQFDLIGLNSICRDVKINSRVFAEQSTMMAIGATSDNHVNLGDIYSSTQNYFNQGLTDRVLSAAYIEDEAGLKITASDGTVLSGSMAYYITIYNELDSLTSYLQRNVLGTLNDTGYWNVTKVPASSDITNAGSLLKTVHYQLNGKDVNYQAIIPFELEITLDGIGGFIVGQIFTIDKSILPKDYYNKNLGFIITGISHSLQNNDWTTTVKTQICLLENDSITNKYQPDKDKLKSVITAARVQASAEGLLLCAMADLMVHQMFIYFLLDRERTGGTGGYPAPLDKSDLKKAQIISQLSDAYSFFANKNTLLKLTGDGTTGPETHAVDPRLPSTSDDAIIQGVKAFFKGAFNRPGKDPEPNVAYDNSEFIRYATQENYGAFDTDQIEKYLKSWYNAAFKLHGTEQDFPQTYDAFTTISGGAKIDLTGFANLINQKDPIGATGDIFRDHSFTDPKVLKTAWNYTWIGSTINGTLAGTPYPIPTTNQGDTFTTFKMQHVLFESDKTYTAPNSPYHTNYKENEVVEIPISPAWKAGTNYIVYSKFDYTRIAGDGLNAVYSTFFKLLDSQRSSLGLGGNFSTPSGFQYMKYNLEKVLP